MSNLLRDRWPSHPNDVPYSSPGLVPILGDTPKKHLPKYESGFYRPNIAAGHNTGYATAPTAVSSFFKFNNPQLTQNQLPNTDERHPGGAWNPGGYSAWTDRMRNFQSRLPIVGGTLPVTHGGDPSLIMDTNPNITVTQSPYHFFKGHDPHGYMRHLWQRPYSHRLGSDLSRPENAMFTYRFPMEAGRELANLPGSYGINTSGIQGQPGHIKTPFALRSLAVANPEWFTKWERAKKPGWLRDPFTGVKLDHPGRALKPSDFTDEDYQWIPRVNNKRLAQIRKLGGMPSIFTSPNYVPIESLREGSGMYNQANRDPNRISSWNYAIPDFNMSHQGRRISPLSTFTGDTGVHAPGTILSPSQTKGLADLGMDASGKPYQGKNPFANRHLMVYNFVRNMKKGKEGKEVPVGSSGKYGVMALPHGYDWDDFTPGFGSHPGSWAAKPGTIDVPQPNKL